MSGVGSEGDESWFDGEKERPELLRFAHACGLEYAVQVSPFPVSVFLTGAFLSVTRILDEHPNFSR